MIWTAVKDDMITLRLFSTQVVLEMSCLWMGITYSILEPTVENNFINQIYEMIANGVYTIAEVTLGMDNTI